LKSAKRTLDVFRRRIAEKLFEKSDDQFDLRTFQTASAAMQCFVIVILALNTGMRRGEILNLEWWQIDFSSNQLIVTKTKSGKPRHIPMNQIVRETLLELKESSRGKYVFESQKNPSHPIHDPKKAFKSAVHRQKSESAENIGFPGWLQI
jgi:integrase